MSVPARKTLLGLVLTASLISALSTGQAARSAGCVVAATTTCTFVYTGAPEVWVVPAGVTSGVFNVLGAEGGSLAAGAAFPGGSGGLGGLVRATVALTPGATLNMRVGGKGTDGFMAPGAGTFTVAGGFNGGGSNSATIFAGAVLGGAGGGSSDVRTSADGLNDRLLVAGGGGGAGVGDGVIEGDGGGSATAGRSVGGCSGGGAGTLTGPGAAGSGCQFPGSPGAAGGLTGGNATLNKGAGGGGLFGGGAGTSNSTPLEGSGGGGGSSYPSPVSPPAGITNVTVGNGVWPGNGLIRVTYTTPTAVTFASAGATSASKGVLVHWRTGTEADLLGFQVYRSRGHSWQRLTRSLIAAKGSVSGGSYRFLDRTARRGVSYRYRIRAVNLDETAAWFGPVRAT